MIKSLFLLLAFLVSCSNMSTGQAGRQTNLSPLNDPFLWLEDIESKKSLDWVRGQNKVTLSHFEKDKSYKVFEEEALKLLDAKDRIPEVLQRGDYLYNFWKDEENVKGLWRRTSVKEYETLPSSGFPWCGEPTVPATHYNG